jgi:hypothetical protein
MEAPSPHHPSCPIGSHLENKFQSDITNECRALNLKSVALQSTPKLVSLYCLPQLYPNLHTTCLPYPVTLSTLHPCPSSQLPSLQQGEPGSSCKDSAGLTSASTCCWTAPLDSSEQGEQEIQAEASQMPALGLLHWECLPGQITTQTGTHSTTKGT